MKDGRKQGQRTRTLIEKIRNQLNGTEIKVNIFIYAIIGGLNREEAMVILGTAYEINSQEVLFWEDLKLNKDGCWLGLFNVKSENMVHEMFPALLTLWCMSAKNECDVQLFDLGHTIQKIDALLKGSQNTKDLKKNPSIEGSPLIFKEYMGIENLSTEQKAIFNSTEKLCEITGPAGSGKTILLLGKIIQIAKKENSPKSFLFVSNEYQVKRSRCEEIFKKANVKSFRCIFNKKVLQIWQIAMFSI